MPKTRTDLKVFEKNGDRGAKGKIEWIGQGKRRQTFTVEEMIGFISDVGSMPSQELLAKHTSLSSKRSIYSRIHGFRKRLESSMQSDPAVEKKLRAAKLIK